MTRASVWITLAVLVLAAAAPVRAQELPVSRLLPDLVNLSAVIDAGTSGDHSQHFVPNLTVRPVIYELNRAIALQAASFPFGPVGSVPAGLGGGAGEMRLFGAGYTGSAFSLGARRAVLSVAYQTTTFDKYDNVDLRASDMTLYLPHAAITPGDESDRDLLRQTVSYKLNRKVVSFTLDYGWGDRFDLGVVVPFVQMAADARVFTQIVRTASPQTPATHEFGVIDRGNSTLPRACSSVAILENINPLSLECHGSATARGFGDVVVRGKVRLFGGRSAVALGVDARLATGNEDELIGLGANQITPALLWSLDAGRIGARVRASYTLSDGTLTSQLADDVSVDLNVPDEIGLAVGVDIGLMRRTTLALDVIGRRIENLPSVSVGSTTFPGRGPGPSPAAYVAGNALQLTGFRDVNQILGAIGLRFDIPGGVMAQVSALIPANSEGLQPQSMAVFSLTKRY